MGTTFRHDLGAGVPTCMNCGEYLVGHQLRYGDWVCPEPAQLALPLDPDPVEPEIPISERQCEKCGNKSLRIAWIPPERDGYYAIFCRLCGKEHPL